MRRRRCSLGVWTIAFCTLSVARLQAEDLIVSDTLTISAPVTYDNVTVSPTGQLTIDAEFTVAIAMTIENGGRVWHSDYDGGPIYRLELTIEPGGLLDIQQGGAIDVSGRGLRGGRHGSNLLQGEGYDSTGTTISRITGRACGGSYGGLGAIWYDQIGGPVYGFAEEPNHYGSGGGLGANAYISGLDGGGLVRINADGATVRVDGAIRANGLNGRNDTDGGGAGGGIKITCASLTGSGNIEAFGGDEFPDNSFSGAGGGGGRIAVYYESTNDLSDTQFNATGGGAVGIAGRNGNGGAGTIYIKQEGVDPVGRLVIAGRYSQFESPLRILTPQVKSLEVRGGTAMVIGRDLNIDGVPDTLSTQEVTIIKTSSSVRISDSVALSMLGSCQVNGNAILTLGPGCLLSILGDPGTDLAVEASSTVTLGPGSTLLADRMQVDASTLTANGGIFGISGADNTLVLQSGTVFNCNGPFAVQNLGVHSNSIVNINEALTVEGQFAVDTGGALKRP